MTATTQLPEFVAYVLQCTWTNNPAYLSTTLLNALHDNPNSMSNNNKNTTTMNYDIKDDISDKFKQFYPSPPLTPTYNRTHHPQQNHYQQHQQSLLPPQNIQLLNHIKRMLDCEAVTMNTIVLSLLYIARLRDLNRQEAVREESQGDLLATSLIVAQKYLDDDRTDNACWVSFCGLPLGVLTGMEREFLERLRWNLHVTRSQYNTFLKTLSTLADNLCELQRQSKQQHQPVPSLPTPYPTKSLNTTRQHPKIPYAINTNNSYNRCNYQQESLSTPTTPQLSPLGSTPCTLSPSSPQQHYYNEHYQHPPHDAARRSSIKSPAYYDYHPISTKQPQQQRPEDFQRFEPSVMLSGIFSQLTGGGQQQSKGKQKSTDSAFHTLLQKAGASFELDSEDGVTVFVKLTREPVAFTRKLQTLIKQTPHPPSTSTEFLDGFVEYISTPGAGYAQGAAGTFRGYFSQGGGNEGEAGVLESLKGCLRPVRVENGREGRESLVKLMLGVEYLQTRLIGILIDKIPEFLFDEINESAGIFENMPRLIMRQLRFLDFVVDPENLTGKLIEALETTSAVVFVQKDLIDAIPEILPDSGHSEMVESLQKHMQENVELVVPILDTLATLGVPADKLEEITEAVVAQLERAELESIPMVIRFLLQTATQSTAPHLIERIRSNLDFDAVALALKDMEGGDQATSEALIFERRLMRLGVDSLRMGLNCQKFVLDAWMTMLQTEFQSAAQFKVIDVLVLIIMRGEPNMQKKIDALLKKVVKAGYFSEKLLKRSIQDHSEGLKQYFPVILAFTESLLRDGAFLQVRAATTMYTSAFCVFDAYNRQQLVGSLVTHIGSGITHEVDAGLRILLKLAETQTANVAKFNLFVKGLLDYLESYSLSQIRTLYEIFATLALHGNQIPTEFESTISFESSLYSDMRIIIKKQLGNERPKFKQMGVLGALSLIKRLGAPTDDVDSVLTIGGAGSSSSSLSLNLVLRNDVSGTEGPPVGSLNQAVELMLQVHNNCSRSQLQCMALFFDELSLLISLGQLHPSIVGWVKSGFGAYFESCFLVQEPERKIISGEAFGMDINSKQGLADYIEELKPQVWMSLIESPNGEGGDSIQETCVPPSVVDDEPPISIIIYPNVLNALKTSREDDSMSFAGRYSVEQERQLVVLLPSCLKLLQAIEFFESNSLESIDQVQQMGIVMYDKATVEETFHSLPIPVKEAMCSSLFYGINFFRETLNAYAKPQRQMASLGDNQRQNAIFASCILRIRHLLVLQDQLKSTMTSVPRWAPVGVFHENSQNGINSMEGENDQQEENHQMEIADEDENHDDINEILTGMTSAKRTQAKKSASKGKKPAKVKVESRYSSIDDLKCVMRELEFETLRLLSYECLEVETSENRKKYPSDSGFLIKFKELEFLVEDLHAKLDFITHDRALSTTGSKALNQSKAGLLSTSAIGFNILQRVPTRKIFEYLIELMPALCAKFELLYVELRKLNEASNGEDQMDVDDLLDSNENLESICNSFDLLLKSFKFIFSWQELLASSNKQSLQSILNCIVLRGRIDLNPRTQVSLSQNVKEAIEYFSAFAANLPSLASAVYLIQLLQALANVADDQAIISLTRHQIGALATEMLSTDWADKNKKSEHIILLLQTQIGYSKDPFSRVEDYFTVAFKGLLAKDADVCMKYPLLDKSTLNQFYKVSFTELGILADTFAWDRQALPACLSRCKALAHTFSEAVNQVKQFAENKSLSIVLRCSKAFIQNFIKKILPTLGKCFKDYDEEAIGILRTVQTGTRFLQTICNEIKAGRDNALIAHVPPLRKVLESFLFEVKKILEMNDCLQAFWVGNLKHKNLNGEAISSQIPISDGEVSSDYDDRPTKKSQAKSKGKAKEKTSAAKKSKKKKAVEEVDSETDISEEDVQMDDLVNNETDEEEEAPLLTKKKAVPPSKPAAKPVKGLVDDEASESDSEEDEEDEEEDDEDDEIEEQGLKDTEDEEEEEEQVQEDEEGSDESEDTDDEKHVQKKPKLPFRPNTQVRPMNLTQSTSSVLTQGTAPRKKPALGMRRSYTSIGTQRL
ncbi:Fanconi anemia group D2 protein [Chytridiales sp. JEL 0842]|nr:Fanconi anemia group D2 protein [Chytridiales sp. JEL 0842]